MDLILLLLISFSVAAAAEPPPRLERSHTEFAFHLDLPYSEAAPLFGALAEMKWDPDWHPQFIFPNPAADQEGSVFTVSTPDGHHALWTTTVFALDRGHIQYLCFIESKMITRIDIHLSKAPSGGTGVRVLYERTALDAAVNAHIRASAEYDARQGPHWKRAIEAIGQKH